MDTPWFKWFKNNSRTGKIDICLFVYKQKNEKKKCFFTLIDYDETCFWVLALSRSIQPRKKIFVWKPRKYLDDGKCIYISDECQRLFSLHGMKIKIEIETIIWQNVWETCLFSNIIFINSIKKQSFLLKKKNWMNADSFNQKKTEINLYSF